MASGSTFSVIGADVTITGNISATADLHIDGRVDGDITCASLVQGEKSAINGVVTERRFFSRAEMSGIRFKPDSLPAAAWGQGILYDPLEPIIR